MMFSFIVSCCLHSFFFLKCLVFLCRCFLVPLQSVNYNDGGVSYQKAQLNRYLPKPKKRNVHYLVDKEKEEEKKEEAEKEEGEEGEVRVLAVVGGVGGGGCCCCGCCGGGGGCCCCCRCCCGGGGGVLLSMLLRCWWCVGVGVDAGGDCGDVVILVVVRVLLSLTLL